MHRFMMQWVSAPESFSRVHTLARKRLMRPSSSPAPSPLRLASISALYGPAFCFAARYFDNSLSVFGQSCQYTKSKYESPEWSAMAPQECGYFIACTIAP